MTATSDGGQLSRLGAALGGLGEGLPVAQAEAGALRAYGTGKRGHYDPERV